MEGQVIYRFGPFQLVPARHALTRGDEVLPLPAKAFRCLVYLIEHHDRAVSRDELLTEIWGTRHLSYGVIAQTILEIRRVLNDTGAGQSHIETVRGFGYRWVAALEIEGGERAGAGNGVGEDDEDGEAPGKEGEPQPVAAPTAAKPRLLSSKRWLGASIAMLSVAALLVAGIFLYSRLSRDARDFRIDGGAALLLPVAVQGGSSHAWVRLGVMEYIAERLRARGQAMVPGDTVIPLLRDSDETIDEQTLQRLTETTGAELILAARAQPAGERWQILLRTLQGAEPPLSVIAEDADLLKAARIAAERMAARLGLETAIDTDVEPALGELLQQIEAALLAQQTGAVRELIDGAPGRLAGHPRLRYQEARALILEWELEQARIILESLLGEPDVAEYPLFSARILLGLLYISRNVDENDEERWSHLVEQATAALAQVPESIEMGQLHLEIAFNTVMSSDFETGLVHFGQARRIFEAHGDVKNLARLDAFVAYQYAEQGDWAIALRLFTRAAESFRALGHGHNELLLQTAVVFVHLHLLDPGAAQPADLRIQSLLPGTPSRNSYVKAMHARILLLGELGGLSEAAQLLDDLMALDKVPSDIMAALELARAKWALQYQDNDALAIEYADSAQRRLMDMNDHINHVYALLLVRAHIASDDCQAAQRIIDSFTLEPDLPQRSMEVKPYAALMEAELATARNQPLAAASAFELALETARADDLPPLVLLHVAQAYLPWLLARHDEQESKQHLRRATYLVELLSEYADRHFDVALLRLRLHQALGPLQAWHTALERAESLAGEREIPEELRIAPAH